MLDYAAIEALSAVIETQSFQMAAQKLFITQSAVSQRIKAIENYYGEPVLIRTLPYRPTSLGLMLIGHFKRVALLEDALHTELTNSDQVQRLAIAISRDSLETWFVPVIDNLKTIMPIRIDITADDQEVTLAYLQKGIVSACAATSPKPLMGCKADFIGYFDYILVASPEFKAKYFNDKKNTRENLQRAPAIIFDNKDQLHGHYLKQFFDITDVEINYHIVPSVAGFRQFALNSYAYALIPAIDITKELKQKKLINLFPDKVLAMPIYWHTWSIETKTYKLFNQLVKNIARHILRQANDKI